jgi:hypothetical protein
MGGIDIMFIKTIVSQHRNDFTAIIKCEYCGHTQELKTGYDDYYYHTRVIPKIKCGSCGKCSNDAPVEN